MKTVLFQKSSRVLEIAAMVIFPFVFSHYYLSFYKGQYTLTVSEVRSVFWIRVLPGVALFVSLLVSFLLTRVKNTRNLSVGSTLLCFVLACLFISDIQLKLFHSGDFFMIERATAFLYAFILMTCVQTIMFFLTRGEKTNSIK